MIAADDREMVIDVTNLVAKISVHFTLTHLPADAESK